MSRQILNPPRGFEFLAYVKAGVPAAVVARFFGVSAETVTTEANICADRAQRAIWQMVRLEDRPRQRRRA